MAVTGLSVIVVLERLAEPPSRTLSPNERAPPTAMDESLTTALDPAPSTSNPGEYNAPLVRMSPPSSRTEPPVVTRTAAAAAAALPEPVCRSWLSSSVTLPPSSTRTRLASAPLVLALTALPVTWLPAPRATMAWLPSRVVVFCAPVVLTWVPDKVTRPPSSARTPKAPREEVETVPPVMRTALPASSAWTAWLFAALLPPETWTWVFSSTTSPPPSALTPRMLAGVEVPPGAITMFEPSASIRLPVPVARRPIWPLALPAVEVVRRALPSKLMVPPLCASAPVAFAPVRFSVMPSAVMPPVLEADNPVALAAAVTVVPWATTHCTPLAIAGLGQVCAPAGDASANAIAAARCRNRGATGSRPSGWGTVRMPRNLRSLGRPGRTGVSSRALPSSRQAATEDFPLRVA